MSLPKYKSHKVVEAFKIESIEPEGDVFKLTGEGCAILVSRKYEKKHKPKVGGYFVKYEDGYLSWSPAEAFEKGYTRVDRGSPVTRDERILETKRIRRDLQDLMRRIETVMPSRVSCIAYERLEEGSMWLGKHLRGLADTDPYPNSMDPSNSIVDPEASELRADK